MKVVVKIGGAAIDDAATLKRCARAVCGLAARGDRVAVVHGGGAALTRMLARLGKEARFVDGLRVTDAETRDLALMVLAGHVNKRVVAALQLEGRAALGFCGGDGGAFRAVKKTSSGADLGFVGEITAVDPRWIEALWEKGGIPVISSLALGPDGEYYNVNADQMASACAAGCGADALVFLTDVAGVKGSDGAVIPSLSCSGIQGLVESGAIRGGMLPKLKACTDALRGGVGRVRILPAAAAGTLAGLGAAASGRSAGDESGTEIRT
jgi:acetylglutamate kinase